MSGAYVLAWLVAAFFVGWLIVKAFELADNNVRAAIEAADATEYPELDEESA